MLTCWCNSYTSLCTFLWQQVEVKNTQEYKFDRGHSVWRALLLPHDDMQLSVLTRLTLSKDHKV
jgi:hypothetical protein